MTSDALGAAVPAAPVCAATRQPQPLLLGVGAGAAWRALVPCPAPTAIRCTLLHRYLRTARRRARALRRVLIVGEGAAVEVARHRVRLARAAGLTVPHAAPAARRGLPVLLKQTTDRLGALLLLVLLAPVFAVVAALIRLDSAGPVFYWQVRVGRDLAPFRMWKFRTMVVAADRMRTALESANEHDGAMFKMRRDPRVTRVGRVLRRFSLDELPQLCNVLAGHMSLVGPRPPLPEEVERYSGTELRRLSVKPGLTGLWQVSGRSDLSWDETVALDLSYVDNWSYGRDLDVLVRTVRAVLDGRGAY
ncbi:sugar transferase [Streptomyces sp. NPDC020883]|uniref:sugar transferase n=1 Tax=Streptomyces sp. NPDC020883 TaxID=3365099 RepID=UPI00378CC100